MHNNNDTGTLAIMVMMDEKAMYILTEAALSMKNPSFVPFGMPMWLGRCCFQTPMSTSRWSRSGFVFVTVGFGNGVGSVKRVS